MKTALVSVAGLSPQVVTETLYALWRAGNVPAEVHILTTLPGRQKIREQLLDSRKGAFYTFCSEYGVDHRAIRFDASTVHVLLGLDGRPIEDLRTAEENAAMADQVVRFVRDLCRRPGLTVHASLAGGRKTMSFYLGYALSLFGREADRLSHVLVSEDFEGHPQFFYPPKEPRDLRTAADKWVNTAQAAVGLLDIPFLRLRGCLPLPTLDGGFAEVIRVAQTVFKTGPRTPPVELWLAEGRVVCGDFSCVLREQPFAVYVHLALAGAKSLSAMSFEDLTGEPFLEELWAEAAQRLGLGASASFNRLPELVDRLAQSPRGHRNFASVVAKVNRAFEEAFPSPVADALRIRRVGRDPTCYGLETPPQGHSLRS